MSQIKHRNILLSIRERPLPFLWLLAFLVPYLSFSAWSVPHFHHDTLSALHISAPCEEARTDSAGDDHCSAQVGASHNSHHTACFLCDWASSSHSQSDVCTHFTGVLASPAEYSAFTVPSIAAPALGFQSRGPPFSL